MVYISQSVTRNPLYGQDKYHNGHLPLQNTQVSLAWWDYLPGGLKIKEYFELTSLQGLKYFSEPGRSLSERYFWIIAMMFVYVGAVIVVYDQIIYFIHTPVLISLDDKSTPVWDIPFPAVTICSENQVRPSYFNYSAFVGRTNMTREEQEIFEYVSLTCRRDTKNAKLPLFSPDILQKVHDEIWRHCDGTYMMSWLSEILNKPCRILQPVLMAAGACHTFNALPGNLLYRHFNNCLYDCDHKMNVYNEGMIWSPDRGYFSSERFNDPPWRMPGIGYGQQASIALNLNIQDFDDNCFVGGHGFMVKFHSPAEVPTLAHPTAYIKADHLTVVKITPDIKVTDKVLRRWTPAERGCFFEDERMLKYFNIYTENNCDMECESNMSLSTCGCIPFFMPRTTETPVCGPLKIYCYTDMISKSLDQLESGCNCMPACFEIDYKIDVSTIKRNWSIASQKGYQFEAFEIYNIEDNLAVLQIHYRTQKVTAMKRIAVFGLRDFIANIGGLLGLFLGFSFLSLFEVIYFCTLRFKETN